MIKHNKLNNKLNMPSINIEKIQELFDRLQEEIDSLTPEKWSGLSDSLIENGLEGLNDEREKALLAFKDEMKFLEVYPDESKPKSGEEGDDSLACRTTEERNVEAARVLQAKELRKKAIFKKLCIYVAILGVSGLVLYKYRETSVGDIVKKFVDLSLTKTIELIPEAVDALSL